MVFANLTQRDKDAFFALLDEYFASRPHLFNGGELPLNVKAAKAINAAAASSTVANAFAARARLAPPPRSPRPAEPALAQEEEPEEGEEGEMPVSVASRIAAAQAALKANPPQPPRRTSTTSTTTSGSIPAGLVTSRAIGTIDTMSKGSAVSSLFKKPQPKPGAGALVPSAFPRERGGFAPPPQRVNSAGSGGVGRKSPQPPPRATAPVEEPDEQEHNGEWAEALYDFSSNDSTDLSITTGERLLITQRDEKDWWMAESDNGRGLVPASYVKIL